MLSAIAADGVGAALLGGLAALLEVLLVVVLGGVELLGREELGHDLLLPLPLLLLQRLPRLLLLLRRVVVDARPVLRPDVVALSYTPARDQSTMWQPAKKNVLVLRIKP